MPLLALVLLTGCKSVQEAYVNADAANYNATAKYTEAGIDAATDISDQDKKDLKLLQTLRKQRIIKNGGTIKKK